MSFPSSKMPKSRSSSTTLRSRRVWASALALGTALSLGAGGSSAQVPPMAPSPRLEPEEAPPRHLVELGVFGGALWVSNRSALHDPRQPYPNFEQPSPEVGVRVAYLPLPFLGAEVEAMGGYGETKSAIYGEAGETATLWALRGHLLLQVPSKSVSPFVVVGGGRLGLQSDAFGADDDPAFHFGAGIKAKLHRRLDVRLDVRDTITQERLAADTAHHFEALAGVSVVLGRPPAKPKDGDADGVVDLQDLCPFEVGLPPDGCPVRDSDTDGILDAQDTCPLEAGLPPDGCPQRDADADGVNDEADECRDIPGIAPTGCPDADGDGILDRDDRCRNVQGVAPDGCPPDSDGDGLVDEQDRCPNQPETANGFEDQDGCPDELPAQVKEFSGVIEGILFASGKAEIRPVSRGLLDRAAKVLRDYPSLRVRIVGHTDSTGSRELNLNLSKQRADAVKQFLTDRGVDAARVGTRGAGPDEPLADNATPAGREKNRRIEFLLLKPNDAL